VVVEQGWLGLGVVCRERASVFLMFPDSCSLTATLLNGARNYGHVSTVLGRVGEMIHPRARMQAAYAGARGGQRTPQGPLTGAQASGPGAFFVSLASA